jgi:hypothetical protein
VLGIVGEQSVAKARDVRIVEKQLVERQER